ncbi:hypothetical protein DENIS_5193 [Desulfonema ishimotonii]|uniref:Uncharacterized protein n=1 Tax=Desulfonema ishimotonii TaxID=45657 RepID=A0A401G4T0_9BACT|nr:hypothetical protein [Desulfonema ishimotonii]GBC64175.1 hypothetical protein DENIS_5193 [Desulfonema ishimotonii]
MDNLNSEIITHESYEWRNEQTKQFGKIPKIKFFPHSCQVKADIIREAGLDNKDREKELSTIRKRYGIAESRHSHARLFEAELNNIMLKVKKAVYTVGLINNLFTQNGGQIAEPLTLLQQIVLEERAAKFRTEKSTGNKEKS